LAKTKTSKNGLKTKIGFKNYIILLSECLEGATKHFAVNKNRVFKYCNFILKVFWGGGLAKILFAPRSGIPKLRYW